MAIYTARHYRVVTAAVAPCSNLSIPPIPFATLAQLPRGADVAISYVAVDSSGNVFAVDAGSGANGAIDEVVKGGNQITALASFNGTNGTTPDSLILDGAGDLFGTTEIGGSGNNGDDL